MDITDQHIERARNLIHLKRFDQAIVEWAVGLIPLGRVSIVLNEDTVVESGGRWKIIKKVGDSRLLYSLPKFPFLALAYFFSPFPKYKQFFAEG